MGARRRSRHHLSPASPPKGATIVAGAWWPPDYAGPPLVSVDGDIAKGLGLNIGDALTVNVLGRDVTAKVANFRRVDWRSFAINFVLVFSPNAFAGAPHSLLMTAPLPEGSTPSAELALVRDAARAFPDRGDSAGARRPCRRVERAGRAARSGDSLGGGRGAGDRRAGAGRRAGGQCAGAA